MVQGSGFRVQGSGFRVQGSGFRLKGLCVQGLCAQRSGFRVHDLGSRFRVWDCVDRPENVKLILGLGRSPLASLR